MQSKVYPEHNRINSKKKSSDTGLLHALLQKMLKNNQKISTLKVLAITECIMKRPKF